MNMVAFGKKVVKFRIPILIISILLLIPAGLGYVNTRVNYDVLTYLPEDIETMQGQDILVKDFGTGAFHRYQRRHTFRHGMTEAFCKAEAITGGSG